MLPPYRALGKYSIPQDISVLILMWVSKVYTMVAAGFDHRNIKMQCRWHKLRYGLVEYYIIT